ncbi:DUF2798 domain-containing protein [Bradyrhizobium sp. U87765 SZCCT0131]|uniref:DUF2798 domain-containing protein n=1 Tax=unclassified Bradyrhizobium TaxID=2631580 RepID=UPI001BA8ADAF|nr:DUF2798 domain-containing protein [Bradyrhizobium sp. U87765 SZCCT0131]MBR1263632.1 DUF2798 domain-containing protein [Bradyrhizobium sp. U87765 SZCCT0134]MBR1309201.1 DUF2798 domain-containing protein [Bradyrhizobium sp. U87765 SZCCT0110]MBR1323964.1 DUF2798 domain-containing protein [Bradyrhizobium sp. U87765 SZCCT0109]MBR1349516.1 DUF2798 domain-containing protein [Bradyrhizobium sp. U87765 SZCCT0048]
MDIDTTRLAPSALEPFNLPRRYATIVAAVLLSLILSLVTAAVSTTVGFGLREGYLLRWLVAWIMSWMIALPVLCAALPMIRRIIIRLEPDAYARRS